MSHCRKDDLGQKAYFRGSRMFQDGGLWYFHTREGTIEGPYYDKEQAEKMLAAYIRTMSSAFAPPIGLALVKDEDHRGLR